MDALASTAVYLAAAPVPASVTGAARVPTVRVTIAMPAQAAIPVAVSATAISAVSVANPFVAAHNRGARSLDEAIADEVRRDALDRPADDGAADEWRDPGTDDGSLGEDVTAAHDARINVIRQRMDAARLEGASAAPSLASLGVKLRLALAARRLALAREAVGRLPADDAAEADPGAAPSAVMAALAHRPARGRHPAAARHGAPAGFAVAALHRPPSLRGSPDRVAATTGVRRDTTLRHLAGRPALHLAAHSGNPHAPLAGAAGDASAQARRLLAAARRLLEDGGGHDPHSFARATPIRPAPVRPAPIRLAGLMHWEGSETWSLASYRRSAA